MVEVIGGFKDEATKSIIVKLNPTKSQRRKSNTLLKKNKVILEYLQDEIDDYEKVKMDGVETAIPANCSECGEFKYLDWEYQGRLICTPCLYKIHSGKSYDVVKELRPRLKKMVNMPTVDYYDEQVRWIYDSHKSFLQSLKNYHRHPEDFNGKPRKPKSFNPNVMELGKSAYFEKNNGNHFIKMSLDRGSGKEMIHIYKGVNRQKEYIDEFIERFAPKDEFFETKEEAEKYKEKLEKEKEENKIKGSIRIRKMKKRNRKPWRVRRKVTKARCKLKKEKGEFYIHYPYKKKVDVPEPDESFEPVTVDLNIKNNLAVISNTKKFYKSDIIRWIHRKSLIASKMQRKENYQNSNKMMDKISERIDYESKKVARWIVENAKESEKPVIVIEDLKHIRERITHKYKKRLNRQNNIWFFGKIFEHLENMAKWDEIPLIILEAYYSSTECSKCGFIKKSNRNSKKSVMNCRRCWHELNDDLNATFVLKKRTELFLKDKKKYEELTKGLKSFKNNNNKKKFDVSKYYKT